MSNLTWHDWSTPLLAIMLNECVLSDGENTCNINICNNDEVYAHLLF